MNKMIEKESLYKPLQNNDVKLIAESAFRVLEKSGVLVFSKAARDFFRKQGADVDDSSCTVKLSRGMVEDAIDSNPSSITLYSRDHKNDCLLEKNNVNFGTGGTAIYVLDPDSGERKPSSLEDVALNAKFVQELDNINLFTINVFPNEVENKDDIDINRFYHSLINTTKHVMGGIYSLSGCKKVVRLAEMIAGSKESLQKEPFISFITLIISPFKIDGIYGDIACFVAEQNLPLVIPTEPICGTTSPITLAGNVLTHIAETLAGITLVQSVRRGAPGICGSVGSISNLQTMDHVGGAVERAMINSAVSQMAQFFKIPLYSTGGTTDAKEVDIQAAYESAMSSLLVAMSGANYIHDIAGLMETDLTVSYEKLVVDNEILGMCRRVLDGITVNEDTLAADLIIENGPGKDFLAHEHTIKYMRNEFFNPLLANRESRERYTKSSSSIARAKKKVQELRTKEDGLFLSKELKQEICATFPGIHS